MSPVNKYLPFAIWHLVLIYHLSFIKQWSILNAKSMVNGQCEMLNTAGGGLG